MRGQGAQGSSEDQVGFERLADLLRRETAEGKGENRIPGEDGNGRMAHAGEPGDGLFSNGHAEMLGYAVMDGEGWDGQPRESSGGRRAVRVNIGGEAVSTLVDGLDAFFRFKPRAQ